MPVWDRLLRVAHWCLAAAITVAWFAGEGWLRLHEWAGYAALAVVIVRVTWGFAGPGYARFGQFVMPPRVVLRYAASVLCHREPRHVGHNPLGGWMALALLAMTALVGVSGHLYTLDAFWGMAWLERLHRASAWSLVGLIALHLAGVAFTSWRHRENLLAAMLTGRKRPPVAEDVG